MKYDKSKFVANGKKVISILKTDKYTAGHVWAAASIMTIRDLCVAEFAEAWKKGDSLEDCKLVITDSFAELIKEVLTDHADGFCANASAAAKAAGYKGTESAITAEAVDELLK